VGGGVVGGVGDGVDEQLVGDLGAAALAGQQRDGSGEVAAGAVAADGQAGGITAELAAVLGDPLDRGVAVFETGRESELGGEAVLDRDDDAGGQVGEGPAGVVVGLDAADDPAAAVVVDEDRERLEASVTSGV